MSREMTQKGVDASRWVTKLLELHGIRTVTWDGGSQGLLNVPAKWCAVINDLANGIQHLAEGEQLPELKKPKTKRPGKERGDGWGWTTKG